MWLNTPPIASLPRVYHNGAVCGDKLIMVGGIDGTEVSRRMHTVLTIDLMLFKAQEITVPFVLPKCIALPMAGTSLVFVTPKELINSAWKL